VQIKIAVRHGHLSESAQQAIREKAGKLLHFFDRLTMIEVMVDLQRPLAKVVEFVAQAEHKHDIVGRGAHEDLQAAVDAALHRVEEQVRRYKERIQDHRRAPSAGDVAGRPGPEVAAEE
jgi:putative sigma-54 modulation protein